LPNVFEITDPETRRTYRMEADDGVTEEQALEQFQSIPQDDWSAFEYNPASVNQQQNAPAPQPGAPVAAPTEEPTKKTDVWSNRPDKDVVPMAYSRSIADRPEIAQALEQAYRSGKRDAKSLNSVIESFEGADSISRLSNADIAGLRQREAYLRAEGTLDSRPLFGTVQERLNVPEPEAPTTVSESLGASSVKAAQNMANSAVGLTAVASNVLGFDGTADELLDLYINNQAAINYDRPDAVGTLENLSWDNAALYGAEAVGELLPQLAGSLGVGLAGKKAGEILASRAAAKMVADLEAKGITRAAAENMVIQAATQKIVRRTTTAAVTAQSIGQETGHIFGNTYAATGEKATLPSIIAGVLSGSLDTILPMRLLGNLGISGDVVRQSFGGALGRVALEGGKSFLIEGATEALQEFIAELPTSYITGESPFTAEMWSQMANAFVKGGIGGLAAGGGSATLMTDYSGPQTLNIQERDQTIFAPTGQRRSRKFKEGLENARQATEAVVNDITSTWENAPQVDTLTNFAGTRFDPSALGVYTGDGNIVLNTEAIIKEAGRRNITPDTLVESVVFHEALGHYGLESLYRENLDSKLWDFYEQGSPEFKRMVDSWVQNNPDAYLDANGDTDIVRATEEVLAEMSEQGTIPRSMMDEIINFIKDFMRNMGLDNLKLFRSGLEYSEREIRTIVALGQSKVRDGATLSNSVAQGVDKYLRAWHGSGSEFDQFDHSYMGTGEGAQVFGWGTYLTDLRGIAESYRSMLGNTTVSWRGVEGPTYQIRRMVEDAALAEGIDSYIADHVFDYVRDNGLKDISVDKIINDIYLDTNSVSPEQKEDFQRAIDLFKKNYKKEVTGKVYEVDLPDTAKWLEWENPIESQPELAALLEEQGVKVVDDDTYRAIQTAYAAIRQKYNELSAKANDDWGLASESDAAFQELQEINPEFLRLKELAQNTVSELSDGQDAYAILADRLKSDKKASLRLAEAGFTGNRYLADNLRKSADRQNDGTDKFNYVVFDDKTPQIVAKYMKPSPPSFDGTAVIDEAGNPLVVYHGTSKDGGFKSFKVGPRGAWFTEDSDSASSYAEENDSQRIVPDRDSRDPWAMKRVNTASRVAPVYLNITNPKVFEPKEIGDAVYELGGASYARGEAALFRQLKSEGYDGIKVKYGDGENVWVVLNNPQQIASAINPNSNSKYMKPGSRASDDVRRFGSPSRYVNEDEAFEAWDKAHDDYQKRSDELVEKDERGEFSEAEWALLHSISDNVMRAQIEYLRSKPSENFNRLYEDQYKNALFAIRNRTENEQLEINQIVHFEAINDNTWKSVEFDPTTEEGTKKFDRLLQAPIDPRTVKNREVTYKFGLNPPEANDKYARPLPMNKNIEPITIEELTADDLFNSMNALDILNGVVDNYQPTPMDFETMYAEALKRGIPPSAVQRLAPVNPGDFTKKLFAYDIAAQKINDRVTQLYEKIQSGRYTMDDKNNFVKASMAFEDITAKIFGLQSEFGRALRAVQEVEYTRKRITSYRDALKGLDNDTSGIAGLDDPATFERYARAMQQQIEQQTKESSTADRIFSVLNTPRSIMSSYDLSAPLRQGVFFITRPEYYSALGKMFDSVSAGGEQRYKDMMKDIMSSENYGLMTAGKLFFSSIDGDIRSKEEAFQSDLAQKVPGVRRSEVAYSAFLNKLRSDLFNSFIAEFEGAGHNFTTNPDGTPKTIDQLTSDEVAILRALGSFINAGTGRGNLSVGDPNNQVSKMLRAAGPLFNALLFSPGLIASRIRLLNPVWYATMPAPIRKAAIAEAAKFSGTALMILGLFSLALGEETVEWDPRSSDFLKIRVGDTRYDILGGMAQYMTLFSRAAIHSSNLIAGTDFADKKNSVGELVKAKDDFRGRTFLDDFMRFDRYKLSPLASFVIDFMDGKNAIGEEFTVAGGIADRMAPLYLQDMFEMIEEDPSLTSVAKAVPGFFGVGMSTYVSAALDTEQVIQPIESFTDNELENGENGFLKVEDGKVLLKPNAQRMYKVTVNAFFQEIMEEQIASPEWPDLTPKERAKVIADARTEAKKATKEYLTPLWGIDDE
jgi:hypothetical protein